jgi:hypothetical protein
MIRMVLAAGAVVATFATTQTVQGIVVCKSDAAGVSGIVQDQDDVVRAINCLGQQIATANNRSASWQAIEAQQRSIRELQDAYNELNRRLLAVEADRK